MDVSYLLGLKKQNAERSQLVEANMQLANKKIVLGVTGGIAAYKSADLVRRLKRYGRLAYLDAPVITSGRRWEKRGPLRTTLTNMALLLGYSLGISPERLATFYYGRTRARGSGSIDS